MREITMAHGVVSERIAVTEHEHDAIREGWRSDLILTGAAAAFVAVAGLVVWLFAVGRDSPQIGFDGEVATYAGHHSFDAGPVTFRFDIRDYDDSATLLVSEIVDPTITLSDLEAYALNRPATSLPFGVPGMTLPEWTGVIKANEVGPGKLVEREMMLTEGRWWVAVNDASAETNALYSAAIIEVKGS